MYPAIRCRHIHVMGRRCGSPALTDKPYCYFHARSRTRHHAAEIVHPMNTIEQRQRDPIVAEYYAGIPPNAPFVFDFPPIEDRESIRVSASMIIGALGRNQVDPKRAASMLYALQVPTAVTRIDDDGISEYLVETETALDEDGNDLAID